MNKRIFINFPLAILIAITLLMSCRCSSAQEATYTDISCGTPSNWEKRALSNTVLYLQSNKRLIVVTGSLTQGPFIDVQLTLRTIKDQNKVYAEKKDTLFGLPVYIYDFDAPQNGKIYKARGYYIIKDKFIYSITYLADSPEDFNEGLSDFENFINGCTFLK